ncbi:class I SAM-dependent methyltransferase [Streptomyces sp. NBC_00433]
MHLVNDRPATGPLQLDAPEAVPDYAFDPTDPWTLAFQAGLERAGLSGRRVYEVGVGSGANVLFMLRDCAAALVAGSDLDPRLPVVAHALLTAAAPELADRFRPVHGPVSLLDVHEAVTEAAAADVVVACLPQVPDPYDPMYAQFRTAQLKTAAHAGDRGEDHVAHYYPWAAFDDHPFNSVGMGLIEALLTRLKAVAPRAEVVLNLGCRIGKATLVQVFRSYGYRTEELASRIVRQHAGTDISFFVALEAAMRGTGYEQDVRCEFYADPAGRCRLSARQAKALLDTDPSAPVYHEICVLRGHPQATGDVR